MSTNSYDSTLSYLPEEGKKPSFYARFKDYMTALNDGLAAWREYERLRMNGVEHQAAAAKSFEKHFSR